MNIYLLAIAVAFIWHPLAYLVNFQDYDSSADLIPIPNYLKHAFRWDSLFFYENTENGYRFEKNHAFYPGTNAVPKLLQFISQHYYLHLTLIIIEITNILSIIFLYKTTIMLFNNIKYAQLVCILFIFSPGSVFFHSFYSESFYTFLSFLGIYLYYKKSSCISLILAATFRSTGAFAICLPGWDILIQFITQIRRKKTFLEILSKSIIPGIIAILLFVIPQVIIIYYPNTLYCTPNHFNPPEWCYQNIPNIYNYVQKKYWGVSFLSSYQFKKAFFIYQGSYGIIIMGYWLLRKSYIMLQQQPRITGLLLQQCILYLIFTLFAHVNCSSRFLSSTMVYYWALADLLSIEKGKQFNGFQKWILFYLFHFNLGGLVLFGNFLLHA